MKRRDFIKISSVGALGTTLFPVDNLAFYNNPVIYRKPGNAKFIWCDDMGQGRNLYACFRKSFELQGDVKEAELCLFADTAYQLYINNRFVQFGPVRFDPRFPLYDKHDIKACLKKGKNVIAIQVNHFEVNTYKAIPGKAAMLSWGDIKTTGGESVSLESTKENWKCKENKAYGIYASRISFALNCRDIFNQAEEEKNWKGIEYDDSKWSSAVELKEQSFFGNCSERNIPFMSGKPVSVKAILNTLPLKKEEDMYSFYMPVTRRQGNSTLADSTYVAYKPGFTLQ